MTKKNSVEKAIKCPESTDTNTSPLLPGVEESRKKFGTYTFEGMQVPRVSEILSTCFDKEHLIYWASRVGLGYTSIKKESTTIGTYAHTQIENLVNNKMVSTDNIYVNKYRTAVETCLYNFSLFLSRINNMGVKINPLYTEYEIVTPWYGGTIDCIANLEFKDDFIQSKNVIIDYKTSKTISPEYIMQTFAYLWAVNWLNQFRCAGLPHVDGIFIIRVDKNKENNFDYIYLDFSIDPTLYQNLSYDLGNLINWFYSQINVNYILKQYKKKDVIEEAYNEYFGNS